MKRLIPLWITALAGIVLIVAYFIPYTQGWGEWAAICFDILAAIAFVLGGGNLLKIHLKKVSDKHAGWGYSVLTVAAFLTMLSAGLLKIGAPSAVQQEYYGESFARVPVESIPAALLFSEGGSIPERPDGKEVHASVRAQLGQEEGRITFRGWMLREQWGKLLEHRDVLEWQCSAERLYGKAQPPDVVKRGGTNLVRYYADHEALAFLGRMSDEQRDYLKNLSGADEPWRSAVDRLHQAGAVQTTEAVATLPPFFDAAGSPASDVRYDPSGRTLTVTGPMSRAQLDALADLFPRARPLDEAGRADFLRQVRALGPLHIKQEQALEGVLLGVWSVEFLREVLDAAGKARTVPRTACECLEDQRAGVEEIALTKTVDEDQALNQAQVAHLHEFVAEPAGLPVATLVARLREAGPFKDAQEEALHGFFATVPTEGELKKNACFAMMKVHDEGGRMLSLNGAQRDFLLADYRSQIAWRQGLGRLYTAAHVVKYPWSGEYRAQGTPFWWLFEYAFKPLQATIFAMLAFYVASAAFRAFRAKNMEAILLLGTAFIILLGRTYAGAAMTSWLPEEGILSELRIENLTVTIMKVFTTAGNRAIMIGIALGIASTSLKVLLAVDRSYLGSGKN